MGDCRELAEPLVAVSPSATKAAPPESAIRDSYVPISKRMTSKGLAAASLDDLEVSYNAPHGRLAERLNAPVLLTRALLRKRCRCKESKSEKPLMKIEVTPSEA